MKFMIEFEEPSREWILTSACPECKADRLVECKTYTGNSRGFHHARIAVALNLEAVHRMSSTYRIK